MQRSRAHASSILFSSLSIAVILIKVPLFTSTTLQGYNDYADSATQRGHMQVKP